MMQQTERYRLNRIETDDVFSPDPLNENADKVDAELGRLDAAVAASDARNCLVKLMGPVTAEYKGHPIVFDLSGIDLAQYAGFILIGGVINASSAMRLNDGTTYQVALHSSGNDTGGFTLITRTAKGRIAYSTFYGSGQRGGYFDCLMSDLYKISFVSESHEAGSNFTLYGIKA